MRHYIEAKVTQLTKQLQTVESERDDLQRRLRLEEDEHERTRAEVEEMRAALEEGKDATAELMEKIRSLEEEVKVGMMRNHRLS